MAHLSSRSNGDVANGTIDPRLLSLGSGESLPQHLESDERQLSASQNSTHSSSNIPDEQFQRRTSLNSGTLQSIAELPTETTFSSQYEQLEFSADAGNASSDRLPSILYLLRSHSFIKDLYDTVNNKKSAWSETSFRAELRELHLDGVRHAETICNHIIYLWRRHDFTLWTEHILETPGFHEFGASELEPADLQALYTSQVQQDTMIGCLKELEEMTKALESLRLTGVLEHHIDISQPVTGPVTEQETSDSCVTDDDDDEKYAKTRKLLEGFRIKPQDAIKTEPLSQARHRKDVRAWARMYRYGCMKLACGSMMVFKDRDKLPKRPRRNRQSQPLPHYDQQSQPLPQHDQQIGDLREDNVDYSSASASSYWSSASMSSNANSNKKRRLPRDENSYSCDFPGCEKSYSCDFPGCEKSYDRKCDLSHHQRSHRPKDTLPYPCEWCGERFPFPKDLRRHEKTHFNMSTWR